VLVYLFRGDDVLSFFSFSFFLSFSCQFFGMFFDLCKNFRDRSFPEKKLESVFLDFLLRSVLPPRLVVDFALLFHRCYC